MLMTLNFDLDAEYLVIHMILMIFIAAGLSNSRYCEDENSKQDIAMISRDKPWMDSSVMRLATRN